MSLSHAVSSVFLSAASSDRMGATTPRIDLSLRDKSASQFVSFADPSSLKDQWVAALEAWGFAPPYTEQYAVRLSEDLVTVDQGELLDENQMRSLKIKIGHRRDVRQAASMARRTNASTEVPPVEEDSDGPRGTAADPAGDAHPDIVIQPTHEIDQEPDGGESDSLSQGSRSRKASAAFDVEGDTGDEGLHATLWQTRERTNARGIRWNALCGGCNTLAEFHEKASSVRHQMKFPKSFDRAFLDNKPMPFQDQDGVYTLVVLRIPDLTNEGGSTVATISNRLVMMFSAKHRQILTYHRCDVDPLERLAIDWEDGVHANSSIFQVVDAVNRCVLKVFRFGLRQLQELSDELEDEQDMVSMVEGLTLVQKKAAVYKRCLNAGRLVLEELQEVHGLEDYIPLICETAQSYESMMDEVAENALGSINMQMALDGFHSSRNTKVFTYISLVCQPITLATGWYGMNFVNMPELEMESAYFVFMGIVVPVALFILLIFLYQFEIKMFSDDERHYQVPPTCHNLSSRLSTTTTASK